MNKIVSFFIICSFFFLLGSCTKKYTCSCVTMTNGVQTGTGSYSARVTKKMAKQWCNDFSATYTTNGVTSSTACSLQ